MKVLAWDTSGLSESVAMLEEGKVLEKSFYETTSSHSETLLDSIKNLLQRCNLSLSEIGLLALTVGPGSFTGLRIGISTAKAFAQLYHQPVAAVSTLLALAQPQLQTKKIVLACMDARLGQVYAAAYQLIDATSPLFTLLEPRLLPIAELSDIAKHIPGEKLLVGSAVQICPDLGQQIGGRWVDDPRAHFVDAVAVGLLGEAMAQRGEVSKGAELRAQYLRVSEAENRLRQKENLK